MTSQGVRIRWYEEAGLNGIVVPRAVCVISLTWRAELAKPIGVNEAETIRRVPNKITET